ncbi:MAG: hypothetical protein ABW217_07190 [Polyangiaceae bacterium]
MHANETSPHSAHEKNRNTQHSTRYHWDSSHDTKTSLETEMISYNKMNCAVQSATQIAVARATRAAGILTVMTLLSGCATGYGTLAGMASGLLLGAAAAIPSSSQTTENTTAPGTVIVGGVVIGAIIGATAAGVASAVAKHEARAEMAKETELDAFRAWRRQHPEGAEPPAPAAAPQPVRSPLYPQPSASAVQEESVRTVDASMLPNPYPVTQPIHQ